MSTPRGRKAAREGGHRPAVAEADPKPDSVRSRLSLAPSTVLKTVATLSDAPPSPRQRARRKEPVTVVVLPDLPLSALQSEKMRAWALRESAGDLTRIEVHSPMSVTVHNSAAMKAKRRTEALERLRTSA